MKTFLFKLAVFALATLSATGLPWLALGAWNRVFGGVRSVFFCYAGSRGYIEAYALPGITPLFRWRPSPIGLLFQGGACGLVLAAPMTEEDFLDPANAAHFARFQVRLRRIARIVGAERITLAGILPGVVRRSPLLTAHDTRPVTVAAVERAVEILVREHFGNIRPPIILLGGAGFLGTALAEAVRNRGADVHVVDRASGDARLPETLRGRPALLIDAARRGAIAAYVEQMWPELILLNETYPEPPPRLIRQIARKGVAVFHLAGIEGRVRGGLPLGYDDAVPCGAGYDAEAVGEVRLVGLG